MKRLISFLFILIIFLSNCALAEFVPSPSLDESYVLEGAILETFTDEELLLLKDLPLNIADAIKFHADFSEQEENITLKLTSIINLDDYQWILMDGNFNIIEIISYEKNEEEYLFKINKISETTFYLIWVIK